MTKPSRFFENGLDAACGGSLWVDSADSSENRTSASGLTEPSVADAQARRRSRRGGWLRRRAGSRWRRTRRRSTAKSAIPWCRMSRRDGPPPSRTESGDDSACNLPPPLTRSMVVVVDVRVSPMARPSSSRCGHSTSTGATARNSGPGKIALAADRRLRDGFLGGDFGQPLRQTGRGERLDRHEIDRSGHRRSSGHRSENA